MHTCCHNASANCMLAYMLLHRGICTFGALFYQFLPVTPLPFPPSLPQGNESMSSCYAEYKIFKLYNLCKTKRAWRYLLFGILWMLSIQISNLGLVNAYCTLCQFFSTPQYECTVNVPYLMPYEKLDPASMRCDYSDVRTVQTCIRAFISSYAVSFGRHKSPDRLHCNAASRSTGFHSVDTLVFWCHVCTVHLLWQLVHSLYSCIWCQC